MERVLNQEPVRVVTHRHSVAVATVLVALRNQIAVMMEHVQVKKVLNKFFAIEIKNILGGYKNTQPKSLKIVMIFKYHR